MIWILQEGRWIALIIGIFIGWIVWKITAIMIERDWQIQRGHNNVVKKEDIVHRNE